MSFKHPEAPRAHEKLSRFVELAGLDEPDPILRAQALAEMDMQQVIDVLSVINNRARDFTVVGEGNPALKHIPAQHDSVDRRRAGFTTEPSQVSPEKDSTGIYRSALTQELVPPNYEDGVEIFEEMFCEAKADLLHASNDELESELTKVAYQFYCAINGGHFFADGNGRTARAAFHLIRDGRLPEEEALIEGSGNYRKISDVLAQRSIADLLHAEGLKDDRGGETEFWDGDLIVVENDDDALVPQGKMRNLRYIALRRVLSARKKFDKDARVLVLDKLGITPEEARAYQEEFANLRCDWYENYINVQAPYIASQHPNAIKPLATKTEDSFVIVDYTRDEATRFAGVH
jgi:hypothetical protein